MENEEEKNNVRITVLIVGFVIFFLVLCCGFRQLALLEHRINELQSYHRLQQELVELSADFESEDEYED